MLRKTPLPTDKKCKKRVRFQLDEQEETCYGTRTDNIYEDAIDIKMEVELPEEEMTEQVGLGIDNAYSPAENICTVQTSQEKGSAEKKTDPNATKLDEQEETCYGTRTDNIYEDAIDIKMEVELPEEEMTEQVGLGIDNAYSPAENICTVQTSQEKGSAEKKTDPNATKTHESAATLDIIGTESYYGDALYVKTEIDIDHDQMQDMSSLVYDTAYSLAESGTDIHTAPEYQENDCAEKTTDQNEIRSNQTEATLDIIKTENYYEDVVEVKYEIEDDEIEEISPLRIQTAYSLADTDMLTTQESWGKGCAEKTTDQNEIKSNQTEATLDIIKTENYYEDVVEVKYEIEDDEIEEISPLRIQTAYSLADTDMLTTQESWGKGCAEKTTDQNEIKNVESKETYYTKKEERCYNDSVHAKMDIDTQNDEMEEVSGLPIEGALSLAVSGSDIRIGKTIEDKNFSEKTMTPKRIKIKTPAEINNVIGEERCYEAAGQIGMAIDIQNEDKEISGLRFEGAYSLAESGTDTPIDKKSKRLCGTKSLKHPKGLPVTISSPVVYKSVGYSENDAAEIYGPENVELKKKWYKPCKYVLPDIELEKCYAILVCIKNLEEQVVGLKVFGPLAAQVAQQCAHKIRNGVKESDLGEFINWC